jgi:hypothetical protein
MAIGQISGPLLNPNLLRNGVDLAFDTDLLYLDVVNKKIGINNRHPSVSLDVNGAIKSTNLEITNTASIAELSFIDNVISSSAESISLEPSGLNPVVYQNNIIVKNNLHISQNTINSNSTLTISSTGSIFLNSNVNISGTLTVDSVAANSIEVGEFVITGNTITNTNSFTILSSNNYVKIPGTGGVVIPFGSDLERPAITELGMIRFNTDNNALEIYNGTMWSNPAGDAITTDQANSIGIISAIVFS